MIEREIALNTGDVILAGTLCLPSQTGSFPCVLMIHGSGPLDRDGNTQQLKLLKVKLNVFNTMAHYLASIGIASLRYDKRGCGKSSGNYWEAGLYDIIADAKAMYQYLTVQNYVKKDSVFLLGHSEGTLIAPKIAVNHGDIAGLILIAPTVQKTEVVLRRQFHEKKEGVERDKGITRPLRKLLWKFLGDPVEAGTAQIKKTRSTDKASFRVTGQRLNAKWLRELLDFDPREAIHEVSCPILVIAGEKDLQVNPQDAIRVAELAKGEVEPHIIQNLTHILRLDLETPSILNYGKLLRKNIDFSVLDLVGNWLQRRLHKEL